MAISVSISSLHLHGNDDICLFSCVIFKEHDAKLTILRLDPLHDVYMFFTIRWKLQEKRQFWSIGSQGA